MNVACLSPYLVCVCNDQTKLFNEHPHKVKSAERKLCGWEVGDEWSVWLPYLACVVASTCTNNTYTPYLNSGPSHWAHFFSIHTWSASGLELPYLVCIATCTLHSVVSILGLPYCALFNFHCFPPSYN